MSTIHTTPSPIIEFIKSSGIPIGIAIYLIVIAYYMTKDPEKLFTKTYLYVSMIAIPIFAGVIYLLTKTETPVASDLGLNDYIKYGGGFLLLLLVIYFFNNISLSTNMVYLATGLFQLIVILMIIVALAIVYKVAYNQLYKMEGVSGFIVNLIFYIPCMLLDLLEFIKADLQQAPKAVYVLLIIELILGLLYMYVPKISTAINKSMSNKDGKVIISDPMHIDTYSSITSYVDLQKGKPSDDHIVNNKFAISAWVYIVPIEPSHSPYNGDATVFEFSDYHPKLIYNGATGKFKAFFNQSKYEEFKMPLQKWNHVVFNYTKSNVDLFVNGELQTTGLRDAINENLNIGDIISVGQAGGLSGGICNMVYFNHPILKYEIKTMYDLNKDREPPII